MRTGNLVISEQNGLTGDAGIHPALAFVGRFHLRMAAAILVLLTVSFVGCLLTGIQVPGLGGTVMAIAAIAAMLLPVPLYWYEKNRSDLLDAALIMLWATAESLLIPFPVRIAARLGRPLQDSLFGDVDRHLAVSVPAIMQWANHHWFGWVVNQSYVLVVILLPLAVILPIVGGKRKYAKELVVANLISFLIGVPLFALLPAIGPWTYFHFPPSQLQLTQCQEALQALRLPGAYVLTSQGAGVVCFPSFHVTWAIFGVAALWGFRWLRFLVAPVAFMIIASTMTTGWHYFTDVLGGIVMAGVSLSLAKAFVRAHGGGNDHTRTAI